MELQPLEDDTLLHRDVVLLLKCPKSVNWVIKARGIVGKLDVVVGIQYFVVFSYRNIVVTVIASAFSILVGQLPFAFKIHENPE